MLVSLLIDWALSHNFIYICFFQLSDLCGYKKFPYIYLASKKAWNPNVYLH